MMPKLRRILMATTLTFSLATVSLGGTIIGFRSSSAGSRTGTMIGSRTGTSSVPNRNNHRLSNGNYYRIAQ